MNRFTRAWRTGVAAYREGVRPASQTPAPSLSPADQKFIGILTPIACFIAGFGGYAGWLPVMVSGILIIPIALAVRRRYFLRS